MSAVAENAAELRRADSIAREFAEWTLRLVVQRVPVGRERGQRALSLGKLRLQVGEARE